MRKISHALGIFAWMAVLVSMLAGCAFVLSCLDGLDSTRMRIHMIPCK